MFKEMTYWLRRITGLAELDMMIKEHEKVFHEKQLDHGNPISKITRSKEMMQQSTSDFNPSKVAYAQGKKERPPFLPNETWEEQEPAMPLPKDYMCLLCSNIMTDAVLIPCCGNNYCDECIRNDLLDTEEHICPTCGESEISPDSLIPNRFLRTSISSFYNETGTMVITTGVKAKPVIHAQHNGPGPQQPGVAPQAQSGSPVTQKPYMPSSRPTGALFGANALPRLQMSRPSSQGPAPLQQLTTNTKIQDTIAPLVPQTTVTDEELAKGMTIKTTLGYRRSMRFSSQDLPKPSPLPPRPPTRPPGPTPRFPPLNMPPPGAMLSSPHRIIPPQAFPGPPPAVIIGPHLHVLLPPPPVPIPVFPPPPGPFPPPGVYAEKPLTRGEFYSTKKMLKEAKEKKRDLIDDFAKELGFKRDQTKRKSLSRSRSRSSRSRYDQHQYYQDYYQRYGNPPSPPPGTYGRLSQCDNVSHPGPYGPNSPPPQGPWSVIESAGKVLSQKPMQPTLASALSTRSIKLQPAKAGHHVILDSEGTPEER